MKKIKVVVKKNEEKIVPFVWINPSTLRPHSGRAGSGQVEEVTIDARLVGEGARLTIVGIFLGKASSSLIFNTNVIHDAPRTKSLTTLRGVFLDHSSINNDGMVRINKGAKGADGFFASKILLFDDARGRSVPSLEIDENDLKAGHASTVGRPNEEQLFYLQSRGLSEKEAEKLIVSGFFEPLLHLITNNQQIEIRGKIEKAMQQNH